MTRFLATLSSVIVLAAAAQAQCLGTPGGVVQTLSATTQWTSADDEGRTIPAIALGFNFPMANAFPLAPTPGIATHAFVDSNGALYLTNSFYGLVRPTGAQTGGIASGWSLRGDAFASPRIAVWGGDLIAGLGGNWGVYVDTSVANQATFYWNDLWNWDWMGPQGSFSFSCTLYSTGIIETSYSAPGTFHPFPFNCVGVSIGDAVGTGNEVSQDLSAGADSGSLGLLFEEFWSPGPDVEGRTFRFTPNGLGGFTSSLFCAPAYHGSYGVGCYDFTAAQEAIYEEFFDASYSTALTGQSMKATPNVNGYVFTWGGGTYIPPSITATAILAVDDGEVDVTPTIPFPHVGGPVPVVSVNSNGFVNMGPVGNNNVFAYGSVWDLLNDPIPAFRGNADYDASPGASPVGAILYEEVGTLLIVTWRDVERYNGGTPVGVNERWQMQLDLVSGEVTWVWDSMQATDGWTMVVGYAPGQSADPGSVSLSASLPITTQPDIQLTPLTLSASPPPVYTIGGPTVPVTYTVDNMIDVAPPFGIGVGLLMFSVAPFPGGLDMTFMGIDNCNLNIASLDVVLGLPNTAPTTSITLTIPQPLSPGLTFYSQAVSLFDPNNPLPNGMNPFGAILSNGLLSYMNTL